jgi:AcrR family transcriptional regulator
MMDDQPVDITRKSPVQRRALQTVETILEATAQILVEEGSERLTTNYLARKAGFSIGTIYQYFPNREAIILALIERQRQVVGRRILAVLAGAQQGSAEEKIRAVVHVLHEAFNVHRMPERRLIVALLRLAAAQGIPTPPDMAARAIFTLWAEGAGAGSPELNESELFVLTQALFEVLRQATLQASPLLGTAELENAILRLILGFLRETGGG